MNFVGKGMADLGFVMDCGESAKQMFPNVDISECSGLMEVIAEIDIQTLGNLIFSNWRYWNHWAMKPMSDKDFEWFVIAFERLAELAEQKIQ